MVLYAYSEVEVLLLLFHGGKGSLMVSSCCSLSAEAKNHVNFVELHSTHAQAHKISTTLKMVYKLCV